MSMFRVATEGKALCGIYCDKGMEKAAEQLKIYLQKITGAEFACLTEKTGARFEIVFDESVKYFKWDIAGEALIISAPTDVKAGWGVFHLLDKLAGCVFCTSTYEVIPGNKNLILETEAYEHAPAFEYNDIHYKDYWEPLFAMKMGTASMAFSKEDAVSLWGNGTCHTMGHLLGYEKYDEHPEYFCMRNGERLKPEKWMTLGGGMHIGNLQPCLSNPDVLEIICENLKKEMDEKPEALYWSVSQDDNFNYCQCPECARVDEEEGSHLGTYIRFVNKVAERFPDKIISTLAYQFTRKPCKITRARENVNFVLCNIEAYRDKPIATDPANADSKNELIEWRKIASNIYYWDYCIQFTHLVSPFPNFRTLAENMKFFAEGGISTMFSQANREVLGEFAELRGYYLAKLTADPYADPQAIIEKFCNAYYGAAAPFILEYIDIMHDALENSRLKLSIFGSPCDAVGSYLKRELFEKYMALFDEAEEAVADDKELLNHVRLARMPLYYAGVEIGYGDKFDQYEMLANFTKIAQENGVDMVWEIGRETTNQFIANSMTRLAKWDD